LWARRQQRLFARYTGIVLGSDHMRREYLRYAIAPEKLHTIPLFAARDASSATGSSPSIDVLFVGRMTPLKGGDMLVRAVHHAAAALKRPLRIVLAGEGPERAPLERLAATLGAPGLVVAQFPGWVDAAGRAALFSRASLVAIPSIWPEPFGLVGLEAAQFGVPAVAFDVGGIGEWLTDGVNGRLADLSGGPAALGDAIAAILDDATMRARLSAGARAAAARLSADAHVATLQDVLIGARAA
jgi:glycosyltransferase involved in cell wall biosynthesis